MKETILSVGIDIGTSTTQLIFSKLTMKNQASSYAVPKIDIVDKEIIYRSHIHRTPLLSMTEIDGKKVRAIIEEEYQNAKIKPENVQTGAVIITGETARKQNADEVLRMLSDMAGDFVVATAGPDLESVLAGKGAGADFVSEREKKKIVNLDIGGGTTNLAMFENGAVIWTDCLDIGGRLIQVEHHTLTYVSPRIQRLAENYGVNISVENLFDICKIMADEMFRALPSDTQGITFSGGVAKCMEESEEEVFRYGDIGVLLAKAIKEHPRFYEIPRFSVRETIRATVVGAGNHTTEVSGSTISYVRDVLPIKNLPVLKILNEVTTEQMEYSIQSQLPLFMEEGKVKEIAIALAGNAYTKYEQIVEMAKALLRGARQLVESPYPLIVVLECDIGKVLGQTLNLLLRGEKKVVCIDGISIQEHAYLDIGEPIAGGRVVPVIIKTLVFNT